MSHVKSYINYIKYKLAIGVGGGVLGNGVGWVAVITGVVAG